MNEQADINVYFWKYLLCHFQEKKLCRGSYLQNILHLIVKHFFAIYNISILYSYSDKKIFKKIKLLQGLLMNKQASLKI